ncbi:MAG: pentapeptide repeat-containing protein [Lachnospiraceae bacterium]|nr:pentapeptide repeat-containing protein [Lachnospiraceae bacterium]MDE7239959.1 pentapeptide repeat-containing protein [Lachnospiraceae bacterium]
MGNNQYKGFAYTKGSDKPTVVYGTSPEDILAKLKSYNIARMEQDKFMKCNIGSLNVETSKYGDYHRYEVATGKDISPIYLQIPPLGENEFRKVVADLDAADAKFNSHKKRWYITPDQDLQKFQAICNQFSNENIKDTTQQTPKKEFSDFLAEIEFEMSLPKVPFQIEGLEIQYAVKMENQQTVIIPESAINMWKVNGSMNEFLDRLNEKAVEQLQQISSDLEQIDPEQIVDESEYSISTSKDSADNRCTIWFNDGREPINFHGDEYGLHFPTMEADAVAEFVAEYFRQQDHPELSMQMEYSKGDWIDCYVPLRLQDSSPNQPIYVENVRHIVGRVQNVQSIQAQEGVPGAGIDGKSYEIWHGDGSTETIRSDEIYASDQARVLLRAAADELTGVQFDLLADRRLSAAQMEEIRFGFKDGLSVEQVALYANPNMTPAEMDLCRIGLTNGLEYAELSRLLKETKELSWTDSRNRLNEVIKEHGVIEKARTVAHEAGLAFSENMTPEEIDPYVYDGSMSAEDYMKMLDRVEKDAAVNSAAEPTVTIVWSESDRLREGETMPLSRANELFAKLDKENIDNPYYLKTKFRIDYVMDGESKHYDGRQDLGDGDGSLVEHIERFHAGYLNNEEWNDHILRNDGQAALEADREMRTRVLNEFVPYLKLHSNLAEMEQTAGEVLKSYVSECRGLINQGDYNLPPVPQLAELDFEAYKEHVREEVAQEAAVAGMTVDEYAANGYEPYAAPEQEAEQTSDFYGMSEIQLHIAEHIQENFVKGFVSIEPVGDDKIRITDLTGESMNLAMTQSGGIIDADTNKIYGYAKEGYRPPAAPEQEVAQEAAQTVDFYGIKVPLENGMRVITMDAIYHVNEQGIEKPDFSSCVFRGIDFPSFFPTSDVNFANSKFYQCRLIDFDMSQSNFQGASLQETYLKDVVLEQCDFSKASLENVRIRSSELTRVNFSETTMNYTYFENCGIAENDFNMAKMDCVHVYDSCDITDDQKNLDTVTYTISGADPAEIEKMKDKVMWRLSGSEIKYERKEELSRLYEKESSDPDTQEWREDLTYEESELVKSWDKQRHMLSDVLLEKQHRQEHYKERYNNMAAQSEERRSVVNQLHEKQKMVSASAEAPAREDRIKKADAIAK